jgi:Cu2+-exporting ATPase
LSAAGCDVQILSGDAPQRVADVAARCGIATWSARNDPAAKLAAIARLQRGGRRVAMVGDGLNDAAVLARADVGVALGCGAALAQAHAAIVLLGDDPAALVDAVRVARRTRAIVRQNLGWAAAYNLVMIPLAAAGAVAPWAAAAGMCLSSLAVTLNGARLASARAGRAGPAAALREATV